MTAKPIFSQGRPFRRPAPEKNAAFYKIRESSSNTEADLKKKS